MNKSTTFLEALQNEETLDLRDNRGKHHDLCLILVEFIVALLCNEMGIYLQYVVTWRTPFESCKGIKYGKSCAKKNGIKISFTHTIEQSKWSIFG